MNRTLALIWIWHYNQDKIKNGCLYGVDVVEDGTTLEAFSLFLSLQFQSIVNISEADTVGVISANHKLSCVFENINIQYVASERYEEDNLLSE